MKFIHVMALSHLITHTSQYISIIHTHVIHVKYDISILQKVLDEIQLCDSCIHGCKLHMEALSPLTNNLIFYCEIEFQNVILSHCN